MKTILLIEDDQALGWLLKKMLTNKYNVVLMRNGFEAFIWLTEGENKCDLIITDINLPSISGKELLEHLVTIPVSNNPPVIVLTGDSDIEKQALPSMVVRVLNKPFCPQTLFTEIKAAMSKVYDTIPFNLPIQSGW